MSNRSTRRFTGHCWRSCIRRATPKNSLDWAIPHSCRGLQSLPFGDAASTTPPLDDNQLLEMIDIGGPTMVRASAKNHQHVLIATNPSRYGDASSAIKNAGGAQDVDMKLRQALALEAFEHTAAYDVGYFCRNFTVAP